jgi:hypothetical protein
MPPNLTPKPRPTIPMFPPPPPPPVPSEDDSPLVQALLKYLDTQR